MFKKNVKYKRMKKIVIATAFVALVFSVMLSTTKFILQTQQSQITNSYALTRTSPKVDLSVYFKSGYETKISIATLFDYDNIKVKTEEKKVNGSTTKEIVTTYSVSNYCEDVLKDENDLDACLLAISLYNTDNLNSDLTYDPTLIEEVNFNGIYAKNKWSKTSDWLNNVLVTFENLKKVTINNYSGDSIFSISQNLETFAIYNNKVLLTKDTFTNLPRTIRDLTYVNSKLDIIENIALDRFTNLQYLNLKENLLTKTKYEESDFGIASLTTLKSVDLSKNKLTDISGFFANTLTPSSLTDINLSKNSIVEKDYGNLFLTLNNPGVKINLSENKIVDSDKIFNNIRFRNTLEDNLKEFEEVNLSKNELTTLPSAAAKISYLVNIRDNKIENFSKLEGPSVKLKVIHVNAKDLQDKIWQNDIYINGRATAIKNEYVNWFLAVNSKVDENNNLPLSTIQNAYIDKVLLPIAVNLYTTNIIAENPNAITATIDDLTSSNLGDGALNVDSIKENLIAPTAKTDFNLMVSLVTNSLNREVVQSYTNYVQKVKALNNINDNTNKGLPNDILIIIIVLSIVGIIVAACVIGFYFFKGNKKTRQAGGF